MDSGTATFYAVMIVGGFILAIAWIALPFAMFGIKPLLQILIREVRETNALLKAAQQTGK